MFEPGLLKQKSILITGGGSGIGRNMGRRFVELGAEVIVCSRRLELLQETVDEFTQLGGSARAYRLDVRDPEMVDDVLTQIWNDGPPNVLVNNAAANFIARTEDLSHRAINAIVNPTLLGALYMTAACGRRWLGAGTKGTVLSITSTSPRNGRAFIVPSAAAKAGVVAMTKSLAVEWGHRGIRLNAIAPGAFPTPGATERLAPTPELARQMEQGNPLGRAGRPEELNDLATFLVCDRSEYINGEEIVIDAAAHFKQPQRQDLFDYSAEDWKALKAR